MIQQSFARFPTLKHALKRAEPIIKNPDELRSGKPISDFGNMRSREFVGNVQLCLVANPNDDESRMTFAPAPDGGDGKGRISTTSSLELSRTRLIREQHTLRERRYLCSPMRSANGFRTGW
jgi:hypothetical protein